MEKVIIKPLSVNEAYKTFCKKCNSGKNVVRVKTSSYKGFEKLLTLSLKPVKIEPEIRLSVFIVFGFSSHGSDLDNCLKTFIDVCQKKFGFNDNRVFEYHLKKTITKKGEEFIEFEITKL